VLGTKRTIRGAFPKVPGGGKRAPGVTQSMEKVLTASATCLSEKLPPFSDERKTEKKPRKREEWTGGSEAKEKFTDNGMRQKRGS